MLVKQYYDALVGLMENSNMTIKQSTGSTYSLQPSYAYNLLKLKEATSRVMTSQHGSGVAFGDGTTPPAFTDYKLSGNVITGISGSVSQTSEEDDDGVTLTNVITVTNNNSNDITISEVCANCQYQAYFMVERTLLDTPLTIPAGGIGQVTYTIRFNYPTA